MVVQLIYCVSTMLCKPRRWMTACSFVSSHNCNTHSANDVLLPFVRKGLWKLSGRAPSNCFFCLPLIFVWSIACNDLKLTSVEITLDV